MIRYFLLYKTFCFQFTSEDNTWSKNIKRAVLNMIQLNLNRRQSDNQQQQQEDSAEQLYNEQQSGQQLLTTSFTVPEVGFLSNPCHFSIPHSDHH